MSVTNNIFSDLPDLPFPEEITNTIFANNHCRIERILSAGHASAEDFWYDQKQNEWVLLLKGEAQLTFKDNPEIIDLKPGDYLLIPAHELHRVYSTSIDEITVWLTVFFD